MIFESLKLLSDKKEYWDTKFQSVHRFDSENKKQEFADSGTLDQQKDKFVSKDVKLPPTYSQVQKAKKKK